MAIPSGTLATHQTSGGPCAAASRIECTTTIWARRCVAIKASEDGARTEVKWPPSSLESLKPNVLCGG